MKYDNHIHAYKIKYLDYHHTVDITKKNSLRFEIVRIIYKYLSTIFSILALIIYIKKGAKPTDTAAALIKKAGVEI